MHKTTKNINYTLQKYLSCNRVLRKGQIKFDLILKK